MSANVLCRNNNSFLKTWRVLCRNVTMTNDVQNLNNLFKIRGGCFNERNLYCSSCSHLIFIGYCCSSILTRDGNRSVGSRFFDHPVKPDETPVKFFFLATKRHLSTYRNIHIYFIIIKTFYKKQY